MTTAEQLAFLQTGAAMYPLTDRAFLRITGPDATRWLNGMVTNNITALAPGQGNYNFLLNAQGRIQGDCTIYREPGEEPTFLLETDKDQFETIHQLLDKFIIMDDVELSREFFLDRYPFEHPMGMALIGQSAPSLLQKLFSAKYEAPLAAPPPPGTMTFGMVNGATVAIFAPPAQSLPRFDIWFEDEGELNIERRVLAAHKILDLSSEAIEAHRILSATPKFGQDIRNTETARDLPQETAQTHALHFNKGCYLGQEIVERIHSRGQVHRTFTQFHLTGTLPTLPTPLEANGKPAGELTSAVQIGDKMVALGYARRQALDTHQILTYTGGTAAPSPN